jgi:carboxylesterase
MVSAPLLSGHEATPRELARAKHTEWITTARLALFELKQHCDRVIVIGFSMGGLIAVQLCRLCGCDGIVLINTPVYYWNLKQIFINLHTDFRHYSKTYLTSGNGLPMHALIEFLRLLSSTKRMIAGIDCSALVLQCENDDTVDPKSADYIFKRLCGRKRLISIPECSHIVFLSSASGKVCAEINYFIEEMRQ